VKVPSLVSYLFVGFSNQYPSISLPVRAFNTARAPALPHSENILRPLKEARVLYFLALSGGEERLKPNIYANSLACAGQGLFWHIITGKADIPLTVRCSANGNCLNITLNRTREPEAI